MRFSTCIIQNTLFLQSDFIYVTEVLNLRTRPNYIHREDISFKLWDPEVMAVSWFSMQIPD